ncbi:MAG: hypothetical protein K5882_00470 [Bacteroidales bacterium]|nr:hypothetical protein [Bacteroidales bacterium]
MTIREYTEDAVRKYLRTVLLIDDQLFESKCENATRQVADNLSDLSGVPDTSVSGSSSSDSVGGAEQSGEVSRNTLEECTVPSADYFSAQTVVDGFYRLGIVCGLYQPETSEFSDGAVPSRIVDLCDHSDVFILDWKLKNNQADSPVPALLEQLLKQDEIVGTPRAVRFCAIYTDEALGTVFSKLHSEIKIRIPQITAEEDRSIYRIRLEGLTIRLYRKTDAPEVEDNPKRFILSSDLAETIVQDFVSEYEGIMSATALRGIAEVRSNAKRILDKFPKGMDPALVLHAGLTLKEKSIVSDISSLLGDEMSSILDSMKVSSEEIYDLCAEYVHNSSDDVFAKTGNATFDKAFADYKGGTPVKHYLEEMFRQKKHCPIEDGNPLAPVFTKKSTNNGKNFAPNHNLLWLLKSFVERRSADDSDYIFGALSALFCQRTIYSKQKILQFGTIVRKCSADGNPSQMYYLCLMPTCDSIRLDDVVTDTSGVERDVPHRFPFWELDFVSTEGEQKTHGLCVKVDGQYHSLCAKGKIRDKFKLVDFYSRQKVVPFDESGTLTCADGNDKFEWIAELKSAHVQRIAERVSREFSRVGLSESEWLRLQVD